MGDLRERHSKQKEQNVFRLTSREGSPCGPESLVRERLAGGDYRDASWGLFRWSLTDCRKELDSQ